MRKNVKGFTIVELLVSVGILVLISPFAYMMVKESNDKQKAVQYADMTKTYSKAYIDAIKFNYATYYQNAINSPNTIQVIKYSDIQNQGFAPSNTSNMFGVKPCVALNYNATSKELQAVLFYTSKQSSNSSITKLLSAKTVNILGAAGGYYNATNGNVLGSGNGWSLANGNSLVNSSNAGSCDYTALTNFGVVMNLNLAENFPKVTDTANYLARASDNSTAQGDSNNANTMQTNIVMDAKNRMSGIFLEGNAKSSSGKPMLLSSTQSDDAKDLKRARPNDITYNEDTVGTVITSKLLADGMTATKAVVPFTYCDAQDLGTFFKQSSSNVPLIGQLVCTFNPLQCQGVDPTGKSLIGNCYLPANDLSIRYHPNTQSFNCPVGYVDPTIPAVATQIAGSQPARVKGNECWECWGSVLGVCTNWQYVTGYCSWQFSGVGITNINPKTYTNYAIYSGVQAYATWTLGGGDRCGNCSGTGTQTTTAASVSSVTCSTGNPVIDSY